MNWTLFQLLIGNSDAHGKNISFFVGNNGIDLAPSCDLLNIDIYGEEFECDLAMAIGDECVGEEVMPYQLAGVGVLRIRLLCQVKAMPAALQKRLKSRKYLLRRRSLA